MANDPTGRRCVACGKPINQNMKRTVNGKHAWPCDPKGVVINESGY